MKVKKYTGSVLEKIREVIVKELGENAVIINIKKNSGKGGILSMGKAASYEVIAAVEEGINVDEISIDKLKTGSGSGVIEELLNAQKEQYRGLRNSIKRLDEKLADVDDRMENISIQPVAIPSADAAEELKNIHEDWAKLVQEALKKISKTPEPTEEDWHEALASIVPTAGGIMFRRTPASAPDIYVLTGPTGVGKTTTLAKLAAKCVLGENLNVGLITTDTFRVAAVDQLREYSSLLGVEIAVAFSPLELEQNLKQFHDKDVVFIDTPGRSQFDSLGIKKICENLGNVSGVCVLLVVPANVRREDAETIVESFGELNPSALIISKTDEATRCDGITRLLDISKLPVLYLTDGQRVPEDLHVASPGIIASLVMPFVKCKEPIKIGDTGNDGK
jgi:flagellar biosynthesis protein FlhF